MSKETVVNSECSGCGKLPARQNPLRKSSKRSCVFCSHFYSHFAESYHKHCFLFFVVFLFFFSWPHFCCQVPGACVQLAHGPASPQPAAAGTSAPLLAWWPGWWWAPSTLWKLQGCLFLLPSCRWHTHEASIGVSLTFSLMSSRCLYLASRSNLKNNPWEGI